MRIGPEDGHGGRVPHHGLGHVGVQVETDHQRHVVSNKGAHPAEQLAFAVFKMLGHHGAVQVQIDRVEAAGGR